MDRVIMPRPYPRWQSHAEAIRAAVSQYLTRRLRVPRTKPLLRGRGCVEQKKRWSSWSPRKKRQAPLSRIGTDVVNMARQETSIGARPCQYLVLTRTEGYRDGRTINVAFMMISTSTGNWKTITVVMSWSRLTTIAIDEVNDGDRPAHDENLALTSPAMTRRWMKFRAGASK
ncbi:MAG: hypothetical protein U1F68_07225 [Gammaproteobacteria bacterium]